jgi:hypothetical protein
MPHPPLVLPSQSTLKRTQTECVSSDEPAAKRAAPTQVWVATMMLIDRSCNHRICPYEAYEGQTVVWQEVYLSEGGAKTALVAKMIEIDMEFGMKWMPTDGVENRESMLATARAEYENKSYDETLSIFYCSMGSVDVDAGMPFFVPELNCRPLQ